MQAKSPLFCGRVSNGCGARPAADPDGRKENMKRLLQTIIAAVTAVFMPTLFDGDGCEREDG
jgi:hypothetical protein